MSTNIFSLITSVTPLEVDPVVVDPIEVVVPTGTVILVCGAEVVADVSFTIVDGVVDVVCLVVETLASL